MAKKLRKVVFLVPGSETFTGAAHVSFGTPSSTNQRLRRNFNKSTKEFRTFKAAKNFAVKKAKSLGLSRVQRSSGRDIIIARRKKK